MTTSTKKTSSSSGQSGMTLKEFKQALIFHGRNNLPIELISLIEIPDTSDSRYMYLTNSRKKETLDLIKEKFGKDSISTQIAYNQDIKSLQPLKAFGFDKSDNNKYISELFKGIDENSLLTQEKGKVLNNINVAIADKITSVYRLIQASENVSDQQSEANPRKQNSANIGSEVNQLRQLKTDPLTGYERSFFVAGHHWGKIDKLAEFIKEKKWENGHDNKFADLVKSIKTGDVIFAKSSWAEKGQGYLTIYAVGVISSNTGDGNFLSVNWQHLNERINLTRGAHYRSTIHKVERDYLDNILTGILEKEPTLIDIINNLSKGNGKYEIEKLIRSKLVSNSKFWWYNDQEKTWGLHTFDQGKDYGLNVPRSRKIDWRIGELILLYDVKGVQSVAGIMELTSFLPGHIEGKFIYEFEKWLTISHLENLELFRRSEISKNLKTPIIEISAELFQQVINASEIGIKDEATRADGLSERTKDKIPFHNDVIAQEDRLGREPVAEAFVNLIKKDVFTEDMNHAFMVHLQGEWGAGKSTFLNLIKKHLNKGEEKWIIVDYNAWQNQHLIPPWWTFIDQIYRQSYGQLRLCRLLLKEKWRRIIWYSGWQKVVSLVFTLMFIGVLFYYGNSILDFMVNAPEANANIENVEKGITLGVFTKLFISLGSVIGLIYSFSKFIATPFFINSTDDATSFVRKSADPMSRIKTHFNELVDDINSKKKKRQLAIFIDDIDRCNRDFIIQLLEGIQTLFKEKRALYIVAGDKNWISTSFEKTYGEFTTEQSTTHHNLGDLFLEKAFQLSLRMPSISDSSKEEYWSHILGIIESEEEGNVEVEQLSPELKEEVEKELDTSEEDITAPEFIQKFEKKHNLSSNAASSLIIEKKNESNTEIRHLLKDLHSMVETNPRAIIRLANNYTMTRSTLIAERKSVNSEKLLRWLIIKDLYPKAITEIASKTQVAFEEALEKEVTDQVIKEKCLQLIGSNKKDKDSLTVEEMKTFEGI
ncbi:MAG: P-loop NTPase fold protein [Marinoscillum sp.]